MIAPRLLLVALLAWTGCRCGGEDGGEAAPADDGTAQRPCPDAVAIEIAYPGASPEEVEHGAVLPVEEALRAIDGVERVDAVATEGRAEVLAWLGAGADLDVAMRDVRDAVEGVRTFASAVERPIIARARGELRATLIILRAPPGVQADLRDRAQRMLPGEVAVRGARARELVIEVDPDRLRAYGLAAEDVARAIREGAFDAPAGSMRAGPGADMVITTQQATLAMEIDQMVIAVTPAQVPVRVGEVARIHDGYAALPFAFDRDGAALVVLAEIPEGADRAPIGRALPDAAYVSPALRVRRCDGGSIEGSVVVATLRPPAGTQAEQLVGVARAALARAHPLGTAAVVVGGDASLSGAPAAPGVPSLELVVPAANPGEVAARLREELAAVPGIEVAITSPSPQAAVALTHPDLEVLERGGRALADALRERGLVDVVLSGGSAARQDVRIEVDRDRAQRFGMSVVDVARQARTVLYGIEAGHVQNGGETMQVIVRRPEVEPADLANVMIDLPGGVSAPLGQVATVTMGTAPAAIQRRDGQRVVYVTATAARGSSDAAVDEAIAAVREELGEVRARRIR